MPRVILSIACMLLFVFLTPNLLGEPLEKEILVRLEVSGDCASLEDDGRLTEAIVTRIPSAFIIRADSVEPDWTLVWKKVPESSDCRLLISNGGAQSNIKIGPQATIKEIDAAASRIAWIASFTEESISKDATNEEKEKIAEDESKENSAADNQEKKEALPNEETPKEESANKEDSKETPPPIKKNPNKTIPPVDNSKLVYDHIDLSLSLVPGVEFHSNPSPHHRGVPALSLNLLGGSHIGLRGFELGFLWNHTLEFVDGLQISAGANITEGSLDGVQIGSVNLALKKSAGLQLGFANIASDINGLQIGLFNFGAYSDVQIGLINIAEKTDLSIGMFNLNWAYDLHPVFWISSDSRLSFGVQHGGNLKYSLLAGVFLPDDAVQIGGGLGYHTTGQYYFTGDIFAYQLLFLGDPLSHLNLNLEAKISAGYRFNERVSVFAGLSMNGLISSLRKAENEFPDAEQVELDVDRTLYLWPNLHLGMLF